MADHDYDVLVVGSGFGGSVTALRLSEKGYRVGVLEAGRRWSRDSFPKTSWDIRHYLWLPRLGMRGIQRLNLLHDVMVISGAGVGGGSLVYANTLYEPLDRFFVDDQWADLTDWREELAPHYDQAKRMLGAETTPFETPAEDVMREVADRLDCADTFHHTDVGVYFGEQGVEKDDPFFGGKGPRRTGCVRCGGCVIGCRYGAKNTLDQNYLYLAEQLGAEIHAESEVVDIEPLPEGGYRLTTESPGSLFRAKNTRTFTATQVVLSAAVLGTLRLLGAMKDRGRLPNLSPRLGELVRTNSEAILTATAFDTKIDYSEGVAIGSSIHPEADTHIEPVRGPKGSNALKLLSTILVDGGGTLPRPIRFVLQILRHPMVFLRSLSMWRWTERSIVLLVMQDLDNSLNVRWRLKRNGRVHLTSEQGAGEPNPTWIPIANKAARVAADVMHGAAGGSIAEAVLNVPTTAHILGGCAIGSSPDKGVLDGYQRVYGHPGLHVADGSAISANLGVNPSLTITAQAERAMSFWPNKGEADPRPALGESYQRIEPIRPQNPIVPADAPAALRW